MPIIAKRPESNFSPAPEGLHSAVCVDVIDQGLQQTAYGKQQHKIRIVWQLEAVDARGQRYLVGRRYTLSLHEKADLRKNLEAWRGKKFTEDELDGFDLEKLIGVNCQLQVTHTLRDDGGVWANVEAVVPAAKGVARLTPIGYTRKSANGGVDADDPIPF